MTSFGYEALESEHKLPKSLRARPTPESAFESSHAPSKVNSNQSRKTKYGGRYDHSGGWSACCGLSPWCLQGDVLQVRRGRKATAGCEPGHSRPVLKGRH